MKKFIVMLVFTLALCLGLAACSQGNSKPSGTASNTTPTFNPTQIETIVSSYKNNQEVNAEGVVYAVAKNGFYLSDSANGHIFVVRGSDWQADVAVGDKVQVVGKFSVAPTIIQIKEVSSCTKVSSDNTPLVAVDSSIAAINALASDDKTAYGKLLTISGTVSKNSTNMFEIADEDGNKVFFDNNSNEAALEKFNEQRITLNAVVYKYLVSDNVWTLSFTGVESDIEATPLTFDFYKEKAVAHINEAVAKKAYGALSLPDGHPLLKELNYTWSVDENEFIKIVENKAEIAIDSVDHEVTLKVLISRGEENETLEYPITLKAIVEQSVSEFNANKPEVDDSKVIIRGVIIAFARNQSLSTRSLILMDPDTKETLPVDFGKNEEYILNTSDEFNALNVGDEIVVNAEYSFSGRPTIQCVSKIEVKSSDNALTHDFENAYVLNSKESYENLAANVYDYSGQLVKFENPFMNYSTSSTPADTNWVCLGYDETSGAAGFKNEGTSRRLAFLIAAQNENLGSDSWHKNYEIPFLGNGEAFDLTVYAYCLYVSDSYIAFIIPDQSAFIVAAADKVIMDIKSEIPASIVTGTINLITTHENVTGNIVWSSSNPEIINPETGVVAEVAENTVVTLTANYTIDGEAKELVLEVSVLAPKPISVSELIATGLADVKYMVEGVVVGFSSDGNAVESRKGVILLDPATGEFIYVDGIGTLYNTEYPNYVDAAGNPIAIGNKITVTGKYGLDSAAIGSSGPAQIGRKHLDVSSEGSVVIGESVEYAFNEEKAVVIDSHDDLLALVEAGLPYGTLIKFVGTEENPIYFGGSSNTAPINYKVFMSNAADNAGTKYGGKTFSFKADVNAANAGADWFSKYLALPEAFVCPNTSNAARKVTGTIYGIVTHTTSTYYQMAIVNFDNWNAKPDVANVKNQILEGLETSLPSNSTELVLPSETYLAGAIKWTTSSKLVNLENGTVGAVTEATEAEIVGTFTYNGIEQEIAYIITITPPPAADPLTVAQIKADGIVGAQYTVQAVFIGYAGNGTWSEFLIMDENTMNIIGVKSTASYNKGDLLKFDAILAESDNTTETGKKYLDSPENVEVVSTGHNAALDLTQAITISSQDSLSKVHEGTEYVLYKFEGRMFGNMYESNKSFEKAYFRVNFNADATALADIRYKNESGKSISAGFRNSYIAKNLGDDWSSKVFGTTEYATGGYPGHEFNGTIYALYVGGNDYYQQFTILDLAHITKAA